MYQILLFIFVFIYATGCIGQRPIKRYVNKNLLIFRAIDSEAINFSELHSLGVAIGDARIVMLGEQDHGDAATFLMKTNLIKYLHEKKGFTVLAFEDDFYALNQGWEELTKNKPSLDSFFFYNVLGIWSQCHTSADLFYNYVPNTFTTKRPLQVSGFDIQFHSTYSGKGSMQRQYDSFLKQTAIPFVATPEYKTQFLVALDSLYFNAAKDTTTFNRLYRSLTVVQNQLDKTVPGISFWKQVTENLMTTALSLKAMRQKDYTRMYLRDEGMAKNLKWLAEVKYPREKIIVWAHNYHISKNSGDFFNPNTTAHHSMGSFLSIDSLLGSQIYSIGFTSASGNAGISILPEKFHTNRYAVEEPVANSLESWMPKDVLYAFVDFKPYESQTGDHSFYMKGSIKKPHVAQKYTWTNVFDGIFFIRKMYTCKPVK